MCDNNCGCSDCVDRLCTSDITCFDGEFNNIVVPEGSDANDVLLLIETYIDEKFSALNELTFTVVEPNNFDLVAGTYSYAQMFNAINTRLGIVAEDGDDAFKFIKEFNTDLDGAVVTITLAEMIADGALPVGYIHGGGASKKCDFNIECWIQNNDPSPSGVWVKGTSTTIPTINVNESTGLISITTGGGSTDIILRVVIVG